MNRSASANTPAAISLMAGQSRRMFLGAALALGTTASFLEAEPGIQPALVFPSEPRRRLAVTSYPFRTLIDSPTNPARDKTKSGMNLKDFPAMVAERFGVHNINPLGDHLSSTDPAYLDAFRKAVAAAGSHVVDLGLAARDFSNADASTRDEAIAFAHRWIDIAAVVGSPSVRQHLKAAPNAPPSVANATESLGKLADYAGKRNVIVNLENDAPGAEDPFFIVQVVSKVNHPFLRALPDFGNSIRGHDAAYNRKAVDMMFKHAYNMSHVKDILHGRDGQEYKIDLPGLFAVARANSYRGYFSMEFDTGSGDPFPGTENLVKQSLQFMV